MADEGSDLDVFEGLTRKERPSTSPAPMSGVPSAPATMRGGMGPSSRPLPPPKNSSGAGAALPKPKPPPSKRSDSAAADESVPSAGGALPKPKLPPSKRPSDSDSPELSVELGAADTVFDEPSSDGNVLPGPAVAELDWDDVEESTSVFDRSASDLFGDLAGRAKVMDADDTAQRHIGGAAALLASSGGSAGAIPSAPPPAATPTPPLL